MPTAAAMTFMMIEDAVAAGVMQWVAGSNKQRLWLKADQEGSPLLEPLLFQVEPTGLRRIDDGGGKRVPG
jgi:hypothetical protein